MTGRPVPRSLLEGLLAMGPGERARLGRLVVTCREGAASVSCWAVDTGDRVAGGAITAVDVPGQVAEVCDSGLFGDVAVESSQDAQGMTTWTLRLWTGVDRATVVSTALHAGSSGVALLAAAQDAATSRWRLASAAAAARAAGVDDDVVDALTGTPGTAPPAPAPQGSPPAPAPVEESATAETTGTARSAWRTTGGAVVRMPMGHHGACVVCRLPATTEYLGAAVHPATCLSIYLEQDPGPVPGGAGRQGPGPVEKGTDQTPNPGPGLDGGPAGSDGPAAEPAAEPAEADPELGSLPAAEHARQPAAPARRRGSKAAAGPVARGNEKGRWAAAAATVDEELHLPGGHCHRWAAGHLGELALLVKTHRLGWGGGQRRPDPGELWLYPPALARVGLPVSVDFEDSGPKAQRDAARAQAFTALNALPFVADALAAGWVLGQGGRLGPRTRVSHPSLLPGGALLEVLSWSEVHGVPLLAAGLDRDGFRQLAPAPVLADRLTAFASRVGVSYRVSPAITGLDLIDATRPPRADADHSDEADGTGADAGEGGGVKKTRFSLVRGVPAELPPFKTDTADTRFTLIEHNFSWHRPWGDLEEATKAMRYAVAFDHGVHFLNPWISTALGVQGLRRHVGQDAAWDGTEAPAYLLVDRWPVTDRRIPDPANATKAVVEQDRVWVTSHTMRQLEKIDPLLPASLTVHESWTWEVTSRYLDKAGTLLKEARYGQDRYVSETAKMIYSATTQKLAAREHNRSYHLWRPDWRDMVMGASRTAVLDLVLTVRDATGLTPLVVDRDTVIYPSTSADPAQAWPGPPGKYGTGAGQWKPAGVADLATWGPAALAGSGSTWQYAKHMEAMTLTGQAVSVP